MNFRKFLQSILIVSFVFLGKSFAEENISNISKEEILETGEKKAEEELIKIKLQDVDEENFTEEVILQGLNKITAKTYPLEGKIGQTITFERLIIKPLKCWKAPPTEKPEDKVLLKIYEKKLNDEEILIFYGWMFSSSPGLSGLEHPTYDITIKECKTTETGDEVKN